MHDFILRFFLRNLVLLLLRPWFKSTKIYWLTQKSQKQQQQQQLTFIYNIVDSHRRECIEYGQGKRMIRQGAVQLEWYAHGRHDLLVAIACPLLSIKLQGIGFGGHGAVLGQLEHLIRWPFADYESTTSEYCLQIYEILFVRYCWQEYVEYLVL